MATRNAYKYKIVLSLRISEYEQAKIRKVCKAMDLTQSELFRKALAPFIRHIHPWGAKAKKQDQEMNPPNPEKKDGGLEE